MWVHILYYILLYIIILCVPCRLLVDEDVSSSGSGRTPLAEAAGEAGEALYPKGCLDQADMRGKVNMYIIKKVSGCDAWCVALAA